MSVIKKFRKFEPNYSDPKSTLISWPYIIADTHTLHLMLWFWSIWHNSKNLMTNSNSPAFDIRIFLMVLKWLYQLSLFDLRILSCIGSYGQKRIGLWFFLEWLMAICFVANWIRRFTCEIYKWGHSVQPQDSNWLRIESVNSKPQYASQAGSPFFMLIVV